MNPTDPNQPQVDPMSAPTMPQAPVEPMAPAEPVAPPAADPMTPGNPVPADPMSAPAMPQAPVEPMAPAEPVAPVTPPMGEQPVGGTGNDQGGQMPPTSAPPATM